ncbi:MAG: galactose-1-phosphate uridylyltransferase [Candidatus Coatesbacteria bacterium]
MADLRKDPITGRWVIIASERAKRPRDFLSERSIKPTGVCPFCAGNEAMTPPEIMAYRGNGGEPNSAGWTLRVVPNRFPALRIEGTLDRRGEGMFDMMNGIGAHEVIIESEEHDRDLPDLDQSGIEGVMRAFRERSVDLRKDNRFRYVLIFRNHGESAGATLEHPHSQLIATPVVPIRVASELNGSRKYFELRERCVFCDMIREELASHKRVVLENDRVAVITPFASRFPFETWIIPKDHQSDFGACGPADLAACGSALRETLRRMRQVLDDPPYNFVIHTEPIQGRDHEVYHWHIEVMPRLTRVAGFEWGSGFYINPTPPEEAAEFMRGAAV